VKYLDHGSIELISVMGSDRRIAEAAWASSARSKGRSSAEVSRLLKYLATHNHWTPFAHAQISLRLVVPIFVARQLMRSNVGIVWNEESRRYVKDEPKFYTPKVWRKASPSMKQGSLEEEIDMPASISYHHEDIIRRAWATYFLMLKEGVAPELARMILPVSMYTTLIGTFSLMALARVYKLRADPHAQWEIRELAAGIDKIVRKTKVSQSWGLLTEAQA
jgi:thymidylate synthase (FAD)